jgi:hypothetical protein
MPMLLKRLLLALAVVAALPAWATDRYAKPSASGTGDCSSAANACTLATCVAGMGDNDSCIASTVDGAYTNPAVVTGRACTTRCYIKTDGDANYATVTLSSGDAFSLSSGENNWTIQNFIVNNSGSGKGYVADAVSGLRLTGLSYFPAYNVVAGEGIYGTGLSDVIVTNYTARHDVVCNNQASAPCTGNGPNDCDFWNDGGALINIGAGSSDVIVQDGHMGYYRNVGIYRDVTTLTIRRNHFANCVNHGCAEIDDATGVLVENNTMTTDISGACSDVYNGGDFLDTYCWANVVIRNNTLTGHGTGPVYFIQHFNSTRTECDNGLGPENMDPVGSAQYMNEKVYNNIIYDGGTANSSPFFACFLMQESKFDTSPSGQYVEDYNVVAKCNNATNNKVGYPSDSGSVQTYAQWVDYPFDGVKPEAHGTGTEPTFTTYADGGLFGVNDNYRLAVGSVGINTGVDSGGMTCPSDDITGAARTGTCDMGAYQYPVAASATPPSIKGTIIRGTVVK